MTDEVIVGIIPVQCAAAPCCVNFRARSTIQICSAISRFQIGTSIEVYDDDDEDDSLIETAAAFISL